MSCEYCHGIGAVKHLGGLGAIPCKCIRDKLVALEAENARMRESLQRIASDYVSEGDCTGCGFGPCMSKTHDEGCPFEIARVTLEGK